MRTRQKRVPLEHLSRRKPTVEPRWAKHGMKSSLSACLHFVIGRVKLQQLFEHPHALPIAQNM